MTSTVKYFKQMLLLVMLIAATATTTWAQGNPGGTGPGGLNDQSPDDQKPQGAAIPFDFGLSLMVAAGVAYSAKKAYHKKQVKMLK